MGKIGGKLEKSEFPIKTMKQLKLSYDDLKAHDSELQNSDVMDQEWIHQQLSKTFSLLCGTYC